MEIRELVKHFKAGSWTDPTYVGQLMNHVGDVSPPDLVKLLETLSSKGVAGTGPDQRNRCAAFVKIAERSLDPSLFTPLVRTLKTADPHLRGAILALAPRVNHPPGHAELVQLLRSSDAGLRKAVAQLLGQIGGKTAFEIIHGYVRDAAFNGRLEAMEALVGMAGHHAAPALADVLKIGNAQEKLHALRILADPRFIAKDPQGSLGAIALVLQDPDQRVVQQAIHAYCAGCSEEEYYDHCAFALTSPNLGIVRAAVEGLRRFRSPRAIRTLEKAFRAGPNAIRTAVLETAEAIGDEVVLPLVVDALSHKALTIRNKAAQVLQALSAAGKVDTCRTIIWLLRSRDPSVRRAAVDIANRVKDPTNELWPKLVTFLRDEDWWVRERVVDALVELAGTKLTRHMVAHLQDPSDVVRRYAVGVLMRLRDPASLGALVRTAQQDEDWWVRESAIEAMGALGDTRAVPYIIDLMNREVDMRYAAVEALEVLEAKEAAPYLAALLGADEDVDLRVAVLRALSRLNDPEQAPKITPLANDENPRIREAAREVLSRWSIQQALPGSTANQLSLLDQLLYAGVRSHADDLILAAGRRPFIKRSGKVEPLSDHVFSGDEVIEILQPHLTYTQQQKLKALQDVDLSYEVKSQGMRFRVNVFQQMTGLAAVFRVVRDEIPDLHKLNLPDIVLGFGDLKNGLVIVGGPTGAGKSTTLAALIDHINHTQSRHVITLEDPIEVVHKPKKCMITQREMGTHSRSFQAALRATLREDPDVILVGEMRDLPTISFAVSAAETGHLVFGTLHTASADTSIDRLINAFPAGQQPQVRSMLAGSLRAVICQHLLLRKDGKGRIAAVEILLNSDAVANLIRKGKAFQIPAVIATSREQGMQSMDVELMRLYKEGLVSAEEVYMKANNKKDFESIFRSEDAPTS